MSRISQVEQHNLRKHGCSRIANTMYSLWKESWMHSRVYDYLIRDEVITIGRSKKGSEHREHIVPCVVLTNEIFLMFDRGASAEDAFLMLDKYLYIAIISKEEQRYMDYDLKLKTTMPDGWRFGIDSPMSRLEVAGIELIQ
ncbi:MAG: hypothetical protein ACLFQJ_09455 [Campylobacterales bacterium]